MARRVFTENPLKKSSPINSTSDLMTTSLKRSTVPGATTAPASSVLSLSLTGSEPGAFPNQPSQGQSVCATALTSRRLCCNGCRSPPPPPLPPPPRPVHPTAPASAPADAAARRHRLERVVTAAAAPEVACRDCIAGDPASPVPARPSGCILHASVCVGVRAQAETVESVLRESFDVEEEDKLSLAGHLFNRRQRDITERGFHNG